MDEHVAQGLLALATAPAPFETNRSGSERAPPQLQPAGSAYATIEALEDEQISAAIAGIHNDAHVDAMTNAHAALTAARPTTALATAMGAPAAAASTRHEATPANAEHLHADGGGGAMGGHGAGSSLHAESSIPTLLLKSLAEKLFTVYDDDLEGGEDTMMSPEDVQLIAGNTHRKLNAAAAKMLLADSGISARMSRNAGGRAAGWAAAEDLQDAVILETQKEDGCTLQQFMQLTMEAAAI